MSDVPQCAAQLAYMILDPSGWRERHMTFAERYAELFQEVSDALDKSQGARRRKGGPPISTLVTRRQSHFRQGLAGEEFVKPPPTEGDESVPWNEGSQQSQLLLVVACRLNKLEGSRPRSLVDWTYRCGELLLTPFSPPSRALPKAVCARDPWHCGQLGARYGPECNVHPQPPTGGALGSRHASCWPRVHRMHTHTHCRALAQANDRPLASQPGPHRHLSTAVTTASTSWASCGG